MAGNKSKTRNGETDVLICGAGAPGMTLALLLADLGLRIVLLDRKAVSLHTGLPQSRTSALMQGSINIVRAAGAWDLAASAGAEMRILRIIDDSLAKPVTAEFRAEEIGLKAFGVNMPNDALNRSLAQKVLKHENITILAPATLESLENDLSGTTASIDGTNYKTRLVVGADGRDSVVRKIGGIRSSLHDYRQSAITCLISHSRPHSHASTEFHRPSGPFTLVPLPGDRSSVVWVDSAEQVRDFMAMNRSSFTQALSDRAKGLFGEITLAGDASAFPLCGLTTKTITGPRIALIAEAAHVLHPLGAQGLNLSLRDAAMLAETLAEAARTGQDPGSPNVLRSYERRRRYDLLSRTIGTDGLNRMVTTDIGLLKSLRRATLRTLSNTLPLKRMAMTHGLAPAVEDSRLARGELL